MARAMKMNGWRAGLWGVSGALLATPAVMMARGQNGWAWGPLDFAVFAVLLAAVVVAFELAARSSGHMAHRLASALALITAFLLVWGTLAVGFIGEEDNRANLVFVGVLLVGLVGGLTARLKPAGMAHTMVAVAAAQGAAAVFAAIVGVLPEAILTAAFIAPWLVCAWLFRVAAAR